MTRKTREDGADRQDGAALLAKACDVLDAVGAASGGLTRAELATRLGLSRSTLYRILGKLTDRGLLRQDLARRAYVPGFRLLEIAQSAWTAPDLPSAAAPELRHLRDVTGETAYVAVLEGRDVVGLGRFEGAHTVRSAAQLGQRKPLHCTSQGKAILAFLPDAERDALVKRLVLRPLTARTITERGRLLAELRIVRSRGFSTDDEEIVEGIRCVGAPVLTVDGRVLGAISVAGPAWRLTTRRLDLLGPEMAAAGRRIGAQFRGPPGPSAPLGPTRVAVHGSPAFLGSAPRWCEVTGALWWADALAPAVHRLVDDLDGTLLRCDAPVRALALGVDAAAIVVDADGVAVRLSPKGEVLARRQGDGLAQLLALRAHPGGELWGSALGPGGGCAVGPLSRDGTVTATWHLPGAASALAWTPDGGALFAAVPDTGTVYRLEPRRPAPLALARLPAGGGRPSGLAADSDGGVWTALREGWSVARLGPDGEIDRLLPLPVPQPTDLCFGGPGRDTLYVTSARDGVPLDVLATAPLSGQLLALSPVAGGATEAGSDWL